MCSEIPWKTSGETNKGPGGVNGADPPFPNPGAARHCPRTVGRSAGFQACCIAGFQTCATLAYHGRLKCDPPPWAARQMSVQRIKELPGIDATRGLRLASTAR